MSSIAQDNEYGATPIVVQENTTIIVPIEQSRVAKKVEEITLKVTEYIKSAIDKDQQIELARILKILPKFDEVKDMEKYIPIVDLAIHALITDKTNIILAKKLCDDIRNAFDDKPYKNAKNFFSIVKESSAGLVILGLGLLLYIVIPLSIILIKDDFSTKKLLNIEAPLILTLAVSGAMGSFVSIMVRLDNFANLKDFDKAVVFFTGFFKPIIGASFALFVFAVINSGILPIKFDPTRSQYFFVAMAFISGFSERFAKDVASKTEQVLVINKDKK